MITRVLEKDTARSTGRMSKGLRAFKKRSNSKTKAKWYRWRKYSKICSLSKCRRRVCRTYSEKTNHPPSVPLSYCSIISRLNIRVLSPPKDDQWNQIMNPSRKALWVDREKLQISLFERIRAKDMAQKDPSRFLRSSSLSSSTEMK